MNSSKIFGIGLSKTGTTSLTKALNMLAIRTIHFPHDEQTFTELQRGEYRLSVLAKYQGVTDTPVAPFFAQLDKAWPGSKFILTIREKRSWLRSAEAHWLDLLKGRPARDPAYKAFIDYINACAYGCTSFSAERFSYVYDTHVRLATEYFARRPDDFMVLDIVDGDRRWDTLCEFLGAPVPAVHFPHEYRTGGWHRVIQNAMLGISQAVPAGATVIMIDQEAFGEEVTDGRRRVPFPESGGKFAGCPPNDAAAIHELERQRKEFKAEFLVVASSSFWWLEHYPSFAEHLRATFPCVLEDDSIVVFDLTA